MSDVRFSILCPTYNHEKYIGQCIESVRAQHYENWELLILDDGSTDETGKTVKPYLKDNRIHYYHQENKGAGRLADNYNFLLSQAKGSYVTILEGDDYADPELLSSHYKALQTQTDAVLSFNRVWVKDPGRTWETPKIPVSENQKRIFSNQPIGSVYNELFFRCFIPAQGVTLKRDVLLVSGGFEKVEGLATVDYPTWLKLASLGPFVFVPQTLATWRRHVTQSTKQRIVPLTELMLPVFEKAYDNLSPELKNHVHVSRKQVVHHWSVQLTKILVRGGNYQLQTQLWKKGRALYLQSFKRWPALLLFWRLKALLGLVFSLLHISWKHWYQFLPKRAS